MKNNLLTYFGNYDIYINPGFYSQCGFLTRIHNQPELWQYPSSVFGSSSLSDAVSVLMLGPAEESNAIFTMTLPHCEDEFCALVVLLFVKLFYRSQDKMLYI